jgi:hypothetical protein
VTDASLAIGLTLDHGEACARLNRRRGCAGLSEDSRLGDGVTWVHARTHFLARVTAAAAPACAARAGSTAATNSAIKLDVRRCVQVCIAVEGTCAKRCCVLLYAVYWSWIDQCIEAVPHCVTRHFQATQVQNKQWWAVLTLSPHWVRVEQTWTRLMRSSDLNCMARRSPWTGCPARAACCMRGAMHHPLMT